VQLSLRLLYHLSGFDFGLAPGGKSFPDNAQRLVWQRYQHPAVRHALAVD
jgi:hypothetical protein